MTEPQRPNPDALLAEIQREEQSAKRGQLKVFFGMSPGVGKTYAMLAGSPILTRKKIDYRGVTLEEMDIDAILARRPGLVLVDELAHTNAPGSRHPKRYQDALDLIDA